MSGLSSRNTLHFTVDKEVQAARKVRGWTEFHRECGKQGLFFDDIEKDGRKFGAISFRLEDRNGYVRLLVSRGSGKGPIDAVLNAFHNAIEAGFPVNPAHADLFTAAAAPVAAPITNEFDDLLGGDTPVTSEFEDLLG